MVDRHTRWFLRIAIILTMTLMGYAVLRTKNVLKRADDAVVVYAYSDMLDNDVLHPFEERTGIKVIVKHFEAVEELVTKLVFSKEDGIDVVVLTDSVVEIFRREKLLEPLDKSLLPSYGELDGRLLGRYYDRENAFCVPYIWSPIGIGYDARIIKQKPEDIGWDLIFGTHTESGYMPPTKKYGIDVGRVCLGEDPWESLFLAALHKYGTIQNIDVKKQKELVQHLRVQKDWLECYTNNLKYFLISGISRAVVTPAAYMVELRQEHPWAEFVLPDAGSLLIMGELCVTKTSKHKKEAHQLIEYLISQEGGIACFDEHAYNPANKTAYPYLPKEVTRHPSLFPNNALFSRLCEAHNQLPLARVEEMWHEIKR